ncbi:ABC transporter substrate-binding protein [Gordonia sp. MP11Mi]|uniref:Fe/B12 periplasmic-binding domain-containing protein n=1 Tax=Gordonia sp. MP11Mi TaxID=3022769 RepID=A0AA97CVW6_9ACTN
MTTTTRSVNRRRAASLFAVLFAAVLAIAACGSDDSTATDDAASTGSGGFPVTVDTAYGEITVGKKPERVVALGGGAWSDFLSFTDVHPVAFSATGNSWPSDQEGLVNDYPWLNGADIGTYDPNVVTAEWKASAEAIAAYQPDLILANSFAVDENMYKQLSQIAPTFVGVSKGVDDWRTTGKALGQLTGTSESIDGAIKQVDDAYAASRAKLPGVQGKTYEYGSFDGTQFAFGSGAWLEGFGLKPAANQVIGGSNVSLENLDQMNGDVLSVYVRDAKTEQALKADPRYAALPATKNGTDHIFGTTFANASNVAGPRSLLWVIDQFTPILEKSDLNKSTN